MIEVLKENLSLRRITMRYITMMILMVSVVATYAAEMKHEQMSEEHMQADYQMLNPLELKDGSFVFVSEKGTMRMVNKDGKPIKMKQDAEMEMMDGSLIMMKNAKLWRHVHSKMKK
jgi:hypothetical protein